MNKDRWFQGLPFTTEGYGGRSELLRCPRNRCWPRWWFSCSSSERAGLSTIIVEADPEVGTPVHCGECLSQMAVDNLDLELPDHVKALDVKGIRIIFPDGTKKLLSETGYVLDKHLFERWLVQEACDIGAELLLSHRVTSMERVFNSENQFTNWKIDGRGNEFPIECRAVIDASGVAGAASKILDMKSEVEVIAGFQYEMLDVPNDGYLDFYLWPKYSPHGYVWMIPKEGGRANVGLVTTDKKGAIKYLNSFIEDTYLDGKPTVNPPWRANGIKVRPFGWNHSDFRASLDTSWRWFDFSR